MVVRAHPSFDQQGGVIGVSKVLLPAVGTQYSRRAAEVAAVMCRSLQATLTILHVVPLMDGDTLGPRSQELSLTFGQHIVDEHADLARSLGASVDTLVLEGASPSQCILELAERQEYDLIFMGINFRPVAGYAFLGHRAERVMRGAPCAAAVLGSG